MPAQIPVFFTRNLLRLGVVTVTSEQTDFPKANLSDNELGVLYKANAGGTQTITVDLTSPGVQTAHAWAVPDGHNLNTATTLVIETAASAGGPWTPITGITKPSTSARRLQRFPNDPNGVAAVFWRLVTTGITPEMGELSIVKLTAMARYPSDTELIHGRVGGLVRHESEAHAAWRLKRAEDRWEATYLIRDLSDDQRTTLGSVFDDLNDGIDPFWFEDIEGVLRFVEWIDAAMLFRATPMRHDVPIRFREMIS